MVGQFAALAKQTPPSSPSQPPPYDHSPLIVAETTTRTEVVTTTTTTTHFFSLPLWRKRGPVSTSSSRQSSLAAHPHGAVSASARSSFYMVEKDLPPTPTEEPGSSREQHSAQSSSSDNVMDNSNEGPQRQPYPLGRLDDDPPAKQSATALAHAVLGVGLTHSLPPLPSSRTGDINTVAFAQPSPPSRDAAVAQPRLRKSKSAQKLNEITLSEPVTDVFAGNDDHERSRGKSFSGSPLLNLGKSVEKGRSKERKEATVRPSSSSSLTAGTKSLARRASFWSRKKVYPQGSDTPSTPETSQLPVLPPISPFDTNIAVAPSSPLSDSNSKKSHSRGLSRSHSARSSLRPATNPSQLDFSESRPRDPPIPGLSKNQAVETGHDVNVVIEDEGNTPKRRPRAQTNPPLLNRLSLGWLSPSSPSVSPLQRFSNNSPIYQRPHTSSSKARQNIPFPADTQTRRLSRPSLERGLSASIPFPISDEEPLYYLRRLQAAVSKSEIAGILASSSDAFYNQALQTYIGEFDFIGDPLDVALRKLLMEVGLPRETQQIDRVIEAFANRYLQCNPSLFTSDDHPYILAFSLIMLHTDAFNKSNKRKMSKADYIKNTRLPGIFPEVLDCFYDNIVFAPFIFIEDPLDINGQRGVSYEGSSQSTAEHNVIGNPPNPGIRTIKVDPYYLITNNLLGPLRIDVEVAIPKENPYSYEGTAGPWEEVQLQQMFANASRIEVMASPDMVQASPFFSKGVIGGLASPPGTSGLISHPTTSAPMADRWTLKLTKVGLLNRKDDTLEGGKKAANRKWKPWSVFLTGSQLLFFRDPTWATSLRALSSDGHSLLPQAALFKPDELLSLRGAIAVYDKTYTRYSNTLRLLLSDRRQLLLQSPNEKELNEWIAGINYASAFKTAGVRIRPLGMSNTDVKLTGVAAATSHLHDLQNHTLKPHIWNADTPHDLMGMLSHDPKSVVQGSALKQKLTIVTNTQDMELEVPTAPEVDGAEQFKATFDQVKADLAAGFSVYNDDTEPSAPSPVTSHRAVPPSATSLHSHTSHLPSRTSIVQSKVDDLELSIAAAQAQLDTNMRLVRNIATLTPFQKSTRERLVIALHNVAQRIIQARLEITRLICHRDILANDIESEGRSWDRAKTIALQAATETLQSRRGTVPRMTLSQPASDPIDIQLSPEITLISSHPFESSPSRRSMSSIGESFHSAIDFGPDWPSSEDVTSSFLGTSHLSDNPTPGSTPSTRSYSTCDGNVDSPGPNSISSPSNFQSSRSSSDALSHEKFYTAPEERAEDWDQTRCAQRVSLVRLPSDIQLKPRLARYKQATLDSES